MTTNIFNLNEDCVYALIKKMEFKEILYFGLTCEKFKTTVLRYIAHQRSHVNLNVDLFYDFELILKHYGNYIQYLRIFIQTNFWQYSGYDYPHYHTDINERLRIKQCCLIDYYCFVKQIVSALNKYSVKNSLHILQICYEVQLDYYDYEFIRRFEFFTDEKNELFFASLRNFNFISVKIFIYATKEIPPNTELTLDYQLTGNKNIRCLCRSSNCRGYI